MPPKFSVRKRTKYTMHSVICKYSAIWHKILHFRQVAFGRRLGIEEPQLMKLMRATLHSHSEWFKLQMCKDRFESLLKIDSLKEVNPPSLSTSAGLLKSNSDSCTHGCSQVPKSPGARTSEDGSSPLQASSRDGCDENAILKVMVSNFNLKNKPLSSRVVWIFFPRACTNYVW